jgi:hypothetical protein
MTMGLLAAGAANAATIAWTRGVITDINDVSTLGTTVLAVNNSGSGAPTTVTVAGIDFTEDNSLTGNYNGSVFALDTGDAGYNTFLGDIDFNSGAAQSNVSINLAVDSGQEYLLQVWYADDNTTGRENTLTGTGDNVLVGDDYGIGTFVADSTTQLFEINTSGGASNNGTRLTGYQLRAIPEPATLGLIAAFGGGILFIRRRFMI